MSDLTVSLLGVPCLELTGTVDSFTCTFPTNDDGTPTLPAGTDYYLIHVASVGYVDSTALGAVTFNLVVNSVSPSVSSPSGGIEAVVSGAGFPLSEDPALEIQVCGNLVTDYVSVSNQ